MWVLQYDLKNLPHDDGIENSPDRSLSIYKELVMQACHAVIENFSIHSDFPDTEKQSFQH